MSNSILDVQKILEEYSKNIQDSISNEAERIANMGVEELKAISPKNIKNTKHRGRYAKGWRVKTSKTFGHINCIIHNATDYQLTHLLENGHLTRNGTRTKPIVHIAPVHDKCINDFEKSVEEIIKKGG